MCIGYSKGKSIRTIIGGLFFSSIIRAPQNRCDQPLHSAAHALYISTVVRNGGGRYAYDVAHGHHHKEKKARKMVDDAWDELRAYQKAAGVKGNLTNLRSAFTTDCA